MSSQHKPHPIHLILTVGVLLLLGVTCICLPWVGTLGGLLLIGISGFSLSGKAPWSRLLSRDIVALIGGLFIFSMSFFSWHIQRQSEQEIEARLAQEEQARAQAAAEHARRMEDRRQRAPQILSDGHRYVTEARAAFGEQDDQRGVRLLEQAESQVVELSVVQPVPDGLGGLRQAIQGLNSEVQARRQEVARLEEERRLVTGIISQVDAALEAEYRDDVEKHDALVALISSVEELPEETVTRHRDEIQPRLRNLQRSERRVRRSAQRIRNERERHARLLEMCGEQNSVAVTKFMAERFFRERAHDPDSVDVVACTTPVLRGDSCWVSQCSVRARNGFGGLILQNYEFNFRGRFPVSMRRLRR